MTTNYALDLNAGLTQVLSDGTNTYLYGNGRIGELQPGGFAYHLGDALGSVRQLADGAATVTQAQAYEPFGAVLSTTDSGASIFGFAGEVRDATGLTFLRARYYDSQRGIFLSPDPVEQRGAIGLNPYVYGRQNPVLYTDPTGRQAGADAIPLNCASPAYLPTCAAILGAAGTIIVSAAPVVAIGVPILFAVVVIYYGTRYELQNVPREYLSGDALRVATPAVQCIGGGGGCPGPDIGTEVTPAGPIPGKPQTGPSSGIRTGNSPAIRAPRLCEPEPEPNPTPGDLGPDIYIRPTATDEPEPKYIYRDGKRIKDLSIHQPRNWQTGLSFTDSPPLLTQYMKFRVDVLRSNGYIVVFDGGQTAKNLPFFGGGDYVDPNMNATILLPSGHVTVYYKDKS